MPHLPRQHRPRVILPQRDRRPSPAQRGYGAAWRRLRRVILSRNIWCVDPFDYHKADGRQVAAEHVDHIIPLAEGGTNDASNLQCLCASCHARKTVLHDGGFGRAKQTMSGDQLRENNDERLR